MQDLFDVMFARPNKNIKVAVVTLAVPDMKQYSDVAARINQKYCDRYGLDFIRFHDVLDTSRHTSWSKLLAVRHVMDMQKYDYVMWVDADTAFLNHAMDLRSLFTCCENGKFFISYDPPACTDDKPGLCTGVWIIKVDDEMRSFIDTWYAAGNRSEYKSYRNEHPWEQRLFDVAINSTAGIQFAKLPYYYFTYCPTSTCPYDGQFMLHAMNGSPEVRSAVLSDTYNKIKELERKPMQDMFNIMSNPPNNAISIAVVTLATPNIREYANITALINQKYCDRYQLDFIQFNNTLDAARHPSWSKLLAVREVMDRKHYDYVMWIDADAAFTNHVMNVRSLIASCGDAKFVIAYDPPVCTHNEIRLCAGVWIIKVDEEMRKFLDTWYEAGNAPGCEKYLHGFLWEQGLLAITFEKMPGIKYLTLPHYFFNFYPTKTCLYHGQFITHLMGNPDELRCERFTEIYNKLHEFERY